MKLFTRYMCDGCTAHFDREADDDVNMVHAHNDGNRVSLLLSALRVEALHFCSDECRMRALSGIDWDALADYALEAIGAPGLAAAREASGPPCERTVLTPSMKQQLRGIEHPDEADPPREPMGSTPT